MALDVIRIAIICIGLLILGFNVAVIWHVDRLTAAANAWRVFMVGKSGITIYVIANLWVRVRDDREFSWLTAIACGSLIVVLIGLWMMVAAERHMPQRRATDPGAPCRRRDDA